MLLSKQQHLIQHHRRSVVAKVATSRRPAAPQQQQHKQPTTTTTTDLSNLKESSQAYIDTYAAPVAKSRQQVYASQEALFDKLLLTPDLDKKLAGEEDQELQQAAHVVESAVAAAIQLAFDNTQQQNSSNNATATTSSIADAGEFGCVALGSDDQCVVDWESESLWDNAAAAAAVGSSLDLVQDEQQQQQQQPSSSPPPPYSDGDGDGAAGAHHHQQQVLNSSSSSTSSVEGLARAAVALDVTTQEAFEVASAHTFLQRLLYKINRLNHFWYDDLSNYVNERSLWVAKLRDTIEEPWQEWELQQLLSSPDVAGGEAQGSVERYKGLTANTLKQALQMRYERDVDPPMSAAQQYVADNMDALGYCHLLAVGAVDGLVEASRQSRVCAGAANHVACTIFRVLMEEYGTGRYSRKHSTFYKVMMEELGLNTKEEAYLDLLPWQWLAASNQNFLITERRRHYLRYAGALSFFEINGPSVYKTYLAAGRRNGLSDAASGYWELHIKEDERHGRQMLEEVALPLVDMYPHDAWEMLLGYDQDRFMGGRAGAALVQHIQVAAGIAKAREEAGEEGGAGTTTSSSS